MVWERLRQAFGRAATEVAPPGMTTSEPKQLALENGLKGAVQYAPNYNNMMEATLVIKTGCAMDPADKQGLAHFLEHVIPDAAKRAAISQKGGHLFAGAGGTFTILTVSLPYSRENRDYMLAVLKQMVAPENISDQAIALERRRILNEIGRDDDNMDLKCSHGLVKNMYQPVNYFTSDAGKKEHVETIDRKDLEGFMRGHYTAGKMSLSVKIPDHPSIDETIAAVKETFNDMPPGGAAQIADPVYTPCEIREQPGHLNQLYCNAGFNLPAPDDFDGYIFDVYTNYINLLINRQLIYDGHVYAAVAGGVLSPGKGGFVGIKADITPETADILMPRVAGIFGTPAHHIDPDLFQTAKQQALAQFASNNADYWAYARSSREMAMELSDEGRIFSAWEVHRNLDKITPQHLMDFTRRLVLADPPSVVSYGDAAKLHTREEFIAMLDKAAQPEAALAQTFEKT